MKKFLITILVLLLIGIAGAWIYWQYNKKHIIRNALEHAISNKTDSLYYIHYDSSSIDEITGSASFYNITLQSDSLQQQLLQFDTASANSIYNVHIAEVSIRGANIPALVSNEKVEANSIKIVHPVIYVIGSGIKKKRAFNSNDTLAIYEKLLGKFKSIKAGEIIIEDGQLNFTHKINEPFVSLDGINVHLKSFSIDSTKDYDNIISYFIKDVNANVKKIAILNENDNSVLNFSGLEYDAIQRRIKLDQFQKKYSDSGKIVIEINKLLVNGLNTDSFILNKQLKADELSVDGGLLTLYQKKSKDSTNDNIEIDNNFFDEALLNKINLDHMRVVVLPRDNTRPPFILSNIKFNASDIQRVYSGTSIRNLIGKSNWTLSADGFSFLSANKMYRLSVGPFFINKETGVIHIDNFLVKPVLSEIAFLKTLKEQKDLYNIAINNIDITGADTKQIITNKVFIAKQATMQPIIKVACDRTIPPYTGSKIGNYPHQLIQKIKFPVYIKKIIARDGYVSYTETGAQSAKKGTVFFSKMNGVIENFTNIPAYINKQNNLIVNGNALLLGVGKLQTKWQLPLNTNDGSFTISGKTTGFDTKLLNPLIEPLALTSFKNGTIKSVDFNMKGDDYGAKGNLDLLYNDLKLEALKNDSTERKKKGFISFIANLVIKDDNPKNDKLRQGEIDVERDKTRSFFNLVWQGIFKAAKRVALGKDDGK